MFKLTKELTTPLKEDNLEYLILNISVTINDDFTYFIEVGENFQVIDSEGELIDGSEPEMSNVLIDVLKRDTGLRGEITLGECSVFVEDDVILLSEIQIII